MKEKQKPQLDCGVDGINIRFASNYELEQDVYRFTRNKRNKEIEYATLKKIKATNEQIEYALYVNLPKILRNTNIQPYSVLDCTKYASVYQFLFDQLTQLFGMNIPELIVTGIECSFSYTLADKELLKPMLNYITRAFISKNNGMHVYVKGVQSKRYEKCEIYCDTLQVQSFRTSRASDCLGSFKCYNKLQEQLDHEAMKSDAQKTYERNSQPVIEEKNRAIGKTYISNFLLRKALSMAVSSDEVTNNE